MTADIPLLVVEESSSSSSSGPHNVHCTSSAATTSATGPSLLASGAEQPSNALTPLFLLQRWLPLCLQLKPEGAQLRTYTLS
jgi:hypothetical protein